MKQEQSKTIEVIRSLKARIIGQLLSPPSKKPLSLLSTRAQLPKSVFLYTVLKLQIMFRKILPYSRPTISEEAVQQVSWVTMNFLLQVEEDVMLQLNKLIFIKSAEPRIDLFTNLHLIVAISARKMNYGAFNPKFSIKYPIICSLWYLLTNKFSYINHS